jgi:branched-chain amino acid transport system ATP-binding protein
VSLLETHDLTAYYGDFQALFGISLAVDEGETLAIIGANGAGKSTFLRSLVGSLAAPPASIRFDGQPIGGRKANEVVRLGLGLVPEGRRLFPSLTVEENLQIGAYGGRRGPWTLERIYRLFPALREKRAVAATALSGGQQQMAAIGRALMANPRLLLCDELSLGLAPIVIRDIYKALPALRDEGITLVIVEQDINQALAVADHVVCFQEGRLSLAGRPRDLTREQIKLAYFGL